MGRIIASLVGFVAFATASWGAVAAAGPAGCAEPQSAVVGGKDLQPTPDELASLAAQGDCAAPSVDTSRSDAKEVDQLYQELMDQTAHDSGPAAGQPQP